MTLYLLQNISSYLRLPPPLNSFWLLVLTLGEHLLICKIAELFFTIFLQVFQWLHFEHSVSDSYQAEIGRSLSEITRGRRKPWLFWIFFWVPVVSARGSPCTSSCRCWVSVHPPLFHQGNKGLFNSARWFACGGSLLYLTLQGQRWGGGHWAGMRRGAGGSSGPRARPGSAAPGARPGCSARLLRGKLRQLGRTILLKT